MSGDERAATPQQDAAETTTGPRPGGRASAESPTPGGAVADDIGTVHGDPQGGDPASDTDLGGADGDSVADVAERVRDADPLLEADDGTGASALTEEQWRERLTDEQYAVLRQQGTERAFTGAYWDAKEPGTYRCAGCHTALFSSETKYDSGSGWPSFTEPIAEEVVALREDRSHGMVRTEAVCANCGGHLGHVFPDGPGPTGERYCMNSLSLELDPEG